jgi:AraC-like DNA-binding protein
MVSVRCKMIVKAELDRLGLRYGVVDIGEVELKENILPGQHAELKTALSKAGLDLMDDKKSALIKKIKTAIMESVRYADEMPKRNLSDYLSEKLNYDYTYLANQFSETAGITVEQFIISQKIERAKELLLYDELTLTEISYKLNYSSVAHLSNQFKKVTGLTPSFFKKMKRKRAVKP